MIRLEEKRYCFRRGGLRARYQPKIPLWRGMIGAAPWASAVLIVVFLHLLSSRMVLRPGVVVELPETDVASGTRPGPTAIVLSHEGTTPGAREEMVYFDDDPFFVRKRDELRELERRFIAAVEKHGDMPLIIEADARVGHGTIVTLCKMAREAGFKEVNLAMRVVDGGLRGE